MRRKRTAARLITLVGAAGAALSVFVHPALSVVGGVLAAVGVFWEGSLSSRESIKNAESQARHERELRRKSDQIASLSEQALHTLTGGNSFCVFSPVQVGTNSFLLAVSVSGEYPLYDVSAEISCDQEAFTVPADREPRTVTLKEAMQGRQSFNIGNLAPPGAPSGYADQTRLVWQLDIPDHVNKRDYRLSVCARNGMWSQSLHFRKLKSDWRIATRVRRSLIGGRVEIVHESVAEDFPTSEEGSIPW